MNATRTRHAFTLIELLVTIATIAVLAGLILPALGRGKAKAKCIVCFNGMRQWAIAAHTYADENDGLLPREEAINGPNHWDTTTLEINADVWYNCLPKQMSEGSRSVAEYAVSAATQMDFYVDKIFTCPSARFDPVTSQIYPNFSIAMNSKLMNDPGERVTLERAEAQDTSRTVLFIDSGAPGEPKFCGGQTPYDGQPKAFASRFSVRHGRAGNIAFFDCHVVTMPGEKVVETDPAKTNYFGRDIFPPVDVMWWIK
jgi:prepilin-type N-terminal cleavage/methylation domain-containing protein/prepilin-type processing-associated H-X9-DG protein